MIQCFEKRYSDCAALRTLISFGELSVTYEYPHAIIIVIQYLDVPWASYLYLLCTCIGSYDAGCYFKAVILFIDRIPIPSQCHGTGRLSCCDSHIFTNGCRDSDIFRERPVLQLDGDLSASSGLVTLDELCIFDIDFDKFCIIIYDGT